MHMTDALLSVNTGLAFWSVSAGSLAYAARKVRQDSDEKKIPMMGVLGAFVFATQMINFTIPGTGSSGHLAGGFLLTIMLDPSRAFITMASILFIQSLFFADGGLLALGCNIFNIALIPCFVVYPLLFRPWVKDKYHGIRTGLVVVLSTVFSFLIGAAAIVFQTSLSGMSELPWKEFLWLMLSIHLVIGLVEGIVTLAILSYLKNIRPDLIGPSSPSPLISKRGIVASLIAALVVAGLLSHFASSLPDGLEWSIQKLVPLRLKENSGKIREWLGQFQSFSAVFPDYQVKNQSSPSDPVKGLGTSPGGIIGVLVILAFAFFLGFILKKQRGRAPLTPSETNPNL